MKEATKSSKFNGKKIAFETKMLKGNADWCEKIKEETETARQAKKVEEIVTPAKENPVYLNNLELLRSKEERSD